MFALKTGGVFGRDLEGLKIVVELDLLVESLPLRIVSVKVVGLYILVQDVHLGLPISLIPACSMMSFSYLDLTSLSSTGSPDLASTQPTYA